MNQLQDSVVRAIVHLNFDEPAEALRVLLIALSLSGFAQRKESTDGNRPAAA